MGSPLLLFQIFIGGQGGQHLYSASIKQQTTVTYNHYISLICKAKTPYCIFGKADPIWRKMHIDQIIYSIQHTPNYITARMHLPVLNPVHKPPKLRTATRNFSNSGEVTVKTPYSGPTLN